MTEAEWLTCDNPTLMLEFLWGKASDRKLRLFACACLHRGVDGDTKEAVAVAERFADHLATEEELEATCNAMMTKYGLAFGTEDSAFQAARRTSDEIIDCKEHASEEQKKEEEDFQCAVLCDIFGNPFRPVPTAPAWRTSNVLSLAQTIYDQGQFESMPVLGDALEDAGCTNPEILNHCRKSGVHVRGCWVVDSVLGKE